MTSTIMMPTTIDTTIRGMCEDAVTQAVTSLAETHGFDVDDALRDLNLGDLKIVRKRGPSPTGEKKTKAKSDKPKVKRGKTGYLLYADSVRPAVKAELEAELEEGTKLKPQATVSAIAKRWKAESDEVRTEFNEQAKELNSAASSPQVSDTESVAESDAPKPAAKKAAKKAGKAEKADTGDDKPKVKRGPTGYLLYAAAIRTTVKAEMQAALPEGEKLKPQATVTEIAKRWKAETDEVRADWNEQAKDGSASGEATE